MAFSNRERYFTVFPATEFAPSAPDLLGRVTKGH